MSAPKTIQTWQMTRPWSKDPKTGDAQPGEIRRTEIPVPELKPGDVLIEVAGCGVCHTDLGYFFDGVPTVVKPPLTLGHEISGRVVAGDEAWVGKEVIIPAVMPCRKCWICKTGRGNRCLDQKMPGNSIGIYGGFSSHIPVPSIDLCEVKNRGTVPLEHLAVVADAGTTPYQAARRAALGPGDNVIVIGAAGGVGSYMTQVASAFGASVVVGIDIDDERLKRALAHGATDVINAKGKTPKDVQDEFRKIAKQRGAPPNVGWKIFEATGTGAGQELGLTLLSFVGKLIVIGYGMTKNQYMISRLMAFDAELIGTWGCLPEHYPVVLDMVLKGKIQIGPFVETRPMSRIVETFNEIHEKGAPARRVVLTPDF